MRSKFRWDDATTNSGHIVAAEHNNYYPNVTEIKLLVHPLLVGNQLKPTDSRCNGAKADIFNDLSGDTTTAKDSSDDKGQIAGYGPPVAFTCDGNQLLYLLVASSRIFDIQWSISCVILNQSKPP